MPLSIATAWSIGATKKAAAADNPSDFWEIVAHYRTMIRTAFLFLTGLVSIANLLSLAGLVQAILGGTREVATRCSSTLSIFGRQILLFSRSGIGTSTEPAVETQQAPDFVFTQQTLPPALTRRVYVPGYIDYLFLAFTKKWFEYEAQVLIAYISNGPLISWMYPVFGIRGASWFLAHESPHF